MKEIRDIIAAYRQATIEGKRTALATVVKVTGSSYRRPGARMLISEDGLLTGAISGGCLEGDALRKALSAIHQQENKLVTYDTTDEDDAKFGVQLGCNGIVHILFEPIMPANEYNPINFLSALDAKRKEAVIVTLFSLEGRRQLGTKMLYRDESNLVDVPQTIEDEIFNNALDALKNKSSTYERYSLEHSMIDAFHEFVTPPIALVIAGAGNDARPLVEIASILGWEITVADGRPAHATALRFPNAKNVVVSKAGDLLAKIDIDERTAFVLMTHNYNYDKEFLCNLVNTDAAYIGTLGPRTKMLRMLEELNKNTTENHDRIHGPVGLDIGAETAEEIAVSIIAEIKAVFSGLTAGKLKNKHAAIHAKT